MYFHDFLYMFIHLYVYLMKVTVLCMNFIQLRFVESQTLTLAQVTGTMLAIERLGASRGDHLVHHLLVRHLLVHHLLVHHLRIIKHFQQYQIQMSLLILIV